MRRPALIVALLAVTALSAAGCGQGSPSPSPTGGTTVTAAAAPASGRSALRHVQGQRNQLLGGGEAAFKARLAALRGHPVVVNVWGSWCPPCRAEFPIFQRASARLGDRVAFLGIDVADNPAKARAFLAKVPVSYPSYQDPNESIAHALGPIEGTPTTFFVARSGKVAYTHVGPYASEATLVADIRRYVQ